MAGPKWKDYKKFVIKENGAYKELTAAEYSSSFGFVGTKPNGSHTPVGTPIRSEGVTFGGRYEDPTFARSGSNNGNSLANDGGNWDARTAMSASDSSL